MKDLCQYGNRPEDEWEILPWIPDPRPPFKIWVKPEQIAPFFLIPHHPYALSLLLKINNGFRTEVFRRLGLTGSSGDWERLVRGVIQEFEENNSGVDLFHKHATKPADPDPAGGRLCPGCLPCLDQCLHR